MSEKVLIPGPSFRFEEAKVHSEGITLDKGFLGKEKLTLLRSLKNRTGKHREISPLFRGDTDVPAAFVPLKQDGEKIGVLALYGDSPSILAGSREINFLEHLGSRFSDAISRWDRRHRSAAQREMDDLFLCESLEEEVFSRAADIMKTYLMAAACMVIFRPDPRNESMEIVATKGLGEMPDLRYDTKTGLTGECAREGIAIRWDESEGWKKFHPNYLKIVERAYGGRFYSWMAVPIGDKDENYGVIKVLDRTTRCNWFTSSNEELGRDLALRLKVIIQKFQHIKKTEDALKESERNAEMAKTAQKLAEEVAFQRQQDIMNITHQIQGPLISIIGAITSLYQSHPPKGVQSRLKFIQDLVEDAIAVSYGTFTTFAVETGRRISFGFHLIQVREELQKLSKRLQETNSRPDLVFSYEEKPNFPKIRMDRNVFISVMYSLLHNATKYADPASKVILECGMERATGEAALKVKSLGEPILSYEKEKIFEKFERGARIRETGRFHHGVGLGLWVARNLMRAVGGDLSVELSPTHKRLSVFVVHFPQWRQEGEKETHRESSGK